MKDVTFSILWHIVQELLGGLFWPLVVLVAVLAVAVAAGLVRGRARFWRPAALVGLAIGILAGLLAPSITQSSFAEVRQPSDWLAMAAVVLGTAVASALLITGLSGLVAGRARG